MTTNDVRLSMAKKVDIWMPLYVADYLSATSRLTTEQHGAYLLLLMDYWKNGAPPNNDAVLAQITKLSPDAWRNARTMLEGFFQVSDEHWMQSRVESEMQKANHNKQTNSKRGKAGADARWGKKDAPSIVGAMPKQSSADSTSPSPSSSKNTKNTVTPPAGVADSVWQDWLIHRKAKRAAVTQSALDGIAKEAGKAGITLQAALEMCCMRGWTGFKAEWLKDKDAGQKSFAEKEYEFKRKRWEAMTGRTSEYTPFLEIEDDTTH
jgi:uncharacterized protein YdaU (DUF1376 family)